jgi:hypothetical protein
VPHSIYPVDDSHSDTPSHHALSSAVQIPDGLAESPGTALRRSVCSKECCTCRQRWCHWTAPPSPLLRFHYVFLLATLACRPAGLPAGQGLFCYSLWWMAQMKDTQCLDIYWWDGDIITDDNLERKTTSPGHGAEEYDQSKNGRVQKTVFKTSCG